VIEDDFELWCTALEKEGWGEKKKGDRHSLQGKGEGVSHIDKHDDGSWVVYVTEVYYTTGFLQFKLYHPFGGVFCGGDKNKIKSFLTQLRKEQRKEQDGLNDAAGIGGEEDGKGGHNGKEIAKNAIAKMEEVLAQRSWVYAGAASISS